MRSWVGIIGGIGLLGACAGGDPEPPVDRDQDGFGVDVDCDDDDPNINPDATEVCDRLDNDCDDLIDDEDDSVDPKTYETFYRDADGDAYGSETNTVGACIAPAGFVDVGGDCDDSRVSVSPEARERCDEIDNDCDPETPDEGVAFRDAQGTWSDVTLQFDQGSPSDPAAISLERDGTLFICAGTWYASIRPEADVSIVGRAGAASTILDGGGRRPGIWVDDPVEVDVEGLEIRDGFDNINAEKLGATLHCENEAEVTGRDLILVGGPAARYGGVVSVIDDCSLSLSDTLVELGEAEHGGLLYVGGGEALLDGVAFAYGRAIVAGGALSVGTRHTDPDPALPSTVECDYCALDFNESKGAGGGAAVGVDALLTLRTSSVAFNQAETLGGGILLDSEKADSALLSLDATGFKSNAQGGGLNDVAIPALGKKGDYLFDVPVARECDELLGCL